MTTMTLNIHNTNILESLKQVLSNMIGVEIMSVNNTADGLDETSYISSSAAMMRIIEKCYAEIAEGKGTQVSEVKIQYSMPSVQVGLVMPFCDCQQ